MNTPVAMNPAVTNPRKALTPSQQDALTSIDYFRHQRNLGSGRYQVGPKRFNAATMAALEQMELIRKSRTGFVPTMAGELVVAKLKGTQP